MGKPTFLNLFAFVLAACGASQAHTGPNAAEAAPEIEREPQLTAPIRIEGVGFAAPAGMVHDTASDLYLVSNVQGSALDADDQAFISRITPKGALDALKWIDGAAPDVTLNAPKGMAIQDDVLYVADIDRLRKFERKTGRPLGEIVLPGATFLKDVAVGPGGVLFVSDGGLTTGFKESGSDAVYRIDGAGSVTKLAEGKELGHPSGLLATASGVWVASFGSGELYELSANGARGASFKLPKGTLDGIVKVASGALVSSWEASAIYRVDLAGSASEAISGVHTPADLGLDERRQRVLVPLFDDDAVLIHPL